MSLTERSWQLVASLSQVVLCARGSSGLDFRVSRRMSLPGASKITQLLNGVDQKDGVGLVAVVDQVLAELESQGMVWTQRIRPQQVGVHPCNRDGLGVNAEDVHSLGADILSWGFSWQQTAGAVCIEEAPGSHEIAEFTKCLSAGCDALPDKGFDQVRFGSVACSHTNMFLKCLAAGVVSSDKDLSEDGYLCLDKVARRDPDFARAAREGLEWKVLSHKVCSDYPKLLGLIVRARNAPSSCCAGGS